MKLNYWLVILLIGTIGLTGFSHTADLTKNPISAFVDNDVGTLKAEAVEVVQPHVVSVSSNEEHIFQANYDTWAGLQQSPLPEGPQSEGLATCPDTSDKGTNDPPDLKAETIAFQKSFYRLPRGQL